MSPPPRPTPFAFARRQEACALTCLSTVSAGSCTALDGTCLCASSTWGTSILECIQAECQTQTILDTAYAQLIAFCAADGVSFTMAEPSFTNTDNASYSLATATSNGTSAAVSATASAAASVSDNSTYPSAIATIPAVNYSNDLGHVSSVMAGICSMFLAISFVFGYLGVRDRLKRKREDSTRSKQTWARDHTSLETANGRGNPSTSGGRKPPIMLSVGQSSSIDPEASYSEVEYERAERLASAMEARREREKAAQAIRMENRANLFTTSMPTLDHHPSPTSATSSSSSSFPTPSAYRSSFVPDQKLDSIPFDDEDGDDKAQFVVLPERNEFVLGPMTGASGRSEEFEMEDRRPGWAMVGEGEGAESTVDLNPDKSA